MKIKNIIQIVATMLNDEDHTSWSEQVLLTYYNMALNEILNIRPDLFNINKEFVCKYGYKQDNPSSNKHFFKVTSNKNGKVCKYIPLATLNDIDPYWMSKSADTEVECYTYDLNNPEYFLVYPPVKQGVTLNVEYAQIEKWYEKANDDVCLSDNWVNCIVDYMLYRAYQRDTEYNPNDNRCQSHYTNFVNSLKYKAESDVSGMETRTATWVGDKAQ